MKTSKRLWALLLTVCMVLAMIPAVSAAKDEGTGTFTYDFDALKIANANNVELSGQTAWWKNAGTVLAEMKAAGLIDWEHYALGGKTITSRDDAAIFTSAGYLYGRAGNSTATNTDYMAFKSDNPGQGKYTLSVNHAASTNGAAQVGVYILPGDTAADQIASLLAGETAATYRMGSYNCYSATATGKDYNTTTLVTGSNLEGTWEVKDNNSYIVVFRMDQGQASNSCRMYLSQLVLTPVAAEKEDEAMIGTESYDTLQDAINDAKSEDEIILQTAAEADKVTVPAGVTLNLNGNTLTAGEIEIAGALVGDGLLVTSNEITCSSDNGGYLPLKTAGGYKLFKVNTQALGIKEVDATTNAYWFHADFEKTAAYDYYADVKIGVQMTWDGGSKDANADETFMSNWATRVMADKELDIKVTVTGLDTVTNFKLTPVIQANGVTISMNTL